MERLQGAHRHAGRRHLSPERVPQIVEAESRIERGRFQCPPIAAHQRTPSAAPRRSPARRTRESPDLPSPSPGASGRAPCPTRMFIGTLRAARRLLGVVNSPRTCERRTRMRRASQSTSLHEERERARPPSVPSSRRWGRAPGRASGARAPPAAAPMSASTSSTLRRPDLSYPPRACAWAVRWSSHRVGRRPPAPLAPSRT